MTPSQASGYHETQKTCVPTEEDANKTLAILDIEISRLLSQKRENESALKSVTTAGEGFDIWKQVGSALINQCKEDATTSLTNRIDYIESELSRIRDERSALQIPASKS